MSIKRAASPELIRFVRRKKMSDLDEDDEEKWELSSEESDDGDLEELVLGGCKSNFKRVEANNNSFNSFFIDKTSSSQDQELSAAWVDEDDHENIPGLDLNKPRGLGNLRHQPLMKADRKTEYEKVVGEAPTWSAIPAKKDSIESDELLTNNFNYVDKSETLPKGTISMSNCKDLNHQQPSKIGIASSEFHKNAQIALTAAADCRLNLFQVDGKSNPKIHSFFTEKFPIRCAHFLPPSEEIVMTSRFKWFYGYNMVSGKINKISCIKGVDDLHLGNFKVSPDGKYMLFFSTFGQMHLVSSVTKELVTTIKMNGLANDGVFTNNGNQLLTLGDEGMVNIWDMRSRLCIHAFADEGCTSGTSISVSPNGQYVACGSASGIVNMYDRTCLTDESPKPLKTFKNLQTSISNLKFNPSSEILVMASNAIENAVKLIHVRSQTVFSNFPGFTNKMIRFPRVLDFSPNSGYLTIGNHKGRALLYRLDHYKSY